MLVQPPCTPKPLLGGTMTTSILEINVFNVCDWIVVCTGFAMVAVPQELFYTQHA